MRKFSGEKNVISLVKLLSIDKMLVLEQCLENRKSLHCQVGCRNICVEEKKCFDVQVWACLLLKLFSGFLGWPESDA